MINFKQETMQSIKDSGHEIDDIMFIGTDEYKISIEDFWQLSDFKYDAGFGRAMIPRDLIIVFKEGWLTREEYDGSEWWRYHEMPKWPSETREIKRLIRPDAYCKTLQEIQLEPRT